MVLSGCKKPEPLTILAASSTGDAIGEVIEAFKKEHRTPVRLVTGGSNQLARQIRSGAPADIFLSANQEWATGIGESKTLLSNRLCVVVRSEGLALNKIERLALADEDVPAGRYAAEAMKTLDFTDDVSIVRGQNVRAALAWVARGEADAAIVYVTDAASTKQVSIAMEISEKAHSKIIYPAVLLNSEEAVLQFFDYLFSPSALDIFEKHGFLVER